MNSPTDDVVNVRIERPLHTQAKEAAKRERRTIQAFVELAVADRLRRQRNRGDDSDETAA